MVALEPRPEVAGPGIPGGPRLASRLGAGRDDGFVGRATELGALRAALDATSDVRLLFVHGPGGIGKTTLLDAMGRAAETAGAGAIHLDARDVECTPNAVQRAIRDRSPEGDSGGVLLIDGYELLDPLDRWFRTVLLPSRPERAVTVIAGRQPPAPDWRLDPGWRRLVSVHQLGALGDAQSRHLLSGLGVTERLDELSRLGRGYPLALAMLAEVDRSGRRPNELVEAPDLVRDLCTLIVDDVPDEAHRIGLATCAHATRTTQDLLVATVGARTEEVWRWLESRPYVRRGEFGLYVHDIVRELFETELAQRSPGAYAQLHRAVRSHFLERVTDRAEPHPDRAAGEILLLHRRTPLATEVAGLRDRGLLKVPRASAADREEIARLVGEHEGPESGALARRWTALHPRGVYCVRPEAGTSAFSSHVYLPGPDDLMVADPIAAAIWRLVDERGPLRPGERVHVNRFAGASGRYQGDPMQLLVSGASCILEWCLVPAAWTFMVAIDEHYGAYFEYLGMTRMLDLDLGGQSVRLYGWDRRRFPVAGFFEMMATRELTGETGPPPAELMRPAPLSSSAFDAAVRAALRRLTRTGGLDGSELLGSTLVADDATDPAADLAGLLRRTIAGLDSERGGPEHRRVLERTYLSGAPSQEAAAEVLHLPFSTYRRHLGRATERLVEILWAKELGDLDA